MTPTNFRKPKTGDRQLRVQFRNGRTSLHTYSARQLRWTDTDSDWDVVGVERA
jgi:hypothetical protein